MTCFRFLLEIDDDEIVLESEAIQELAEMQLG
ncbi:MAG: hypothetical protein ACI9P7_002320 [Candidatus Azotimanducaceae bacterium]|jgi:hypothetical protein